LGGEIDRARALEGVARVAQVLEDFLKDEQQKSASYTRTA
jgi:hypothetical protein